MDKVSWFELPADDTARAGTFYSKVFGWETSDMGGGSLYTKTTPSNNETIPYKPGAINGDISPRSGVFDKPLIVINVEDIDAKIRMVTDAGGKLVLPRQDPEGMEIAWAIISDTEDNKVGLIQEL